MEKKEECIQEGNTIKVELNLLSVVYLKDGEEKKVKDLVHGDLVEIQIGKSANSPIRYLPIKSLVKNAPNAIIYLSKGDV